MHSDSSLPSQASWSLGADVQTALLGINIVMSFTARSGVELLE